jgi:tetratricopeptide (TPR) repeat protein
VLAKIKDTPKLTDRERAYLNAVKLLYGEGDKHARDAAYSAAMEKIYRAYPEDLDAAAFYSLSLLGLVGPGDKGYRLQAQAGALALAVYEKNPNHPGAAHYIIHAFDDPEHAILALPAARRYADIAPEAHHARHMPSHIFLQLGMWPEAAASNESAWESSDNWMKRKKLPLSVRDYHSLHWLLYAYLQQGRYAKAEQLLKLMKQVMSESTYDNKLRPGYYENNYANMAAAFIVETERWDLANELFPTTNPQNPSPETPATGSHGGHSATAAPSNTLRYSGASRTLPAFIRGLSASVRGAETEALDGIRGLEVAALSAAMKKDYVKAIELMKKATEQEEQSSPPSGPPSLIKPTHELLGEILLRAGRPADAATQFKIALLRQPNRARSLLGAARAAAQSGDQTTAAAMYSKLLEQWNQADTDFPELREARAFLKVDK